MSVVPESSGVLVASKVPEVAVPCANQFLTLQNMEDLVSEVDRTKQGLPVDLGSSSSGLGGNLVTNTSTYEGQSIATALTLIPKTSCPHTMNDYRPIACCNVLYKTITKILANRLQPILPLIINKFQAAFVKGRSISDNIGPCWLLKKNKEIARRPYYWSMFSTRFLPETQDTYKIISKFQNFLTLGSIFKQVPTRPKTQ
ncbi:hypothetical protein RHGRI_023811 [Rhododendron griersonianum]|uniref:Reverse transcriptase domain-containing protein n=1 Tax=Rhododendron griersonianum TaxID=479676 RepID=A0AAV6JAC7_9ERIC|nr:hypothetical protein RHGRI_023811 [Rhododendron griersonianum]